jgi:hypothetical protein
MNFSYSIIQSAYRCLKHYKLLYVDKLKPPVDPSADMAFGTAIHAGVQAILEGANGLEVFNLFWSSIKEQPHRFGRNSWEELKEQGEVLLSRFERLHAKKFKIFKMEERIYTKMGDINLEGTPDFVGEFNGVPSIVDFKTAGYAYEADKLVCNEQMPLYAWMAEKEWGYKAEQYVYLVFVKGRDPRIQTLTLPIDRAAQDRTLTNIAAVCQKLEKETVFTENRASCLMGTQRCEFWDVCHGSKT